ncbi:uncharacterized protein B0H18DRAFT_1118134 [Fomitopsis serialis]|uniref:uncharacterized protein n=1 Tax=Fomitopsis serialis TaxID=139415 RepID=UPI002007FB32|nr:uncharacterized protein B0H18DRAFT_1118134 [Neoantrodia serialis]KAH9928113.1 hypothetical protein B0H18DRAFT_1118134 [Neoantrodia serialis]
MPVINSTAFEVTDLETEELMFVGRKTEIALLKLAKLSGLQEDAIDVVVKLDDSRCRVYLKRAQATSLRGSESTGVDTREMDDLARDNVSRTIFFYTNWKLRATALPYRDFESWPPARAPYIAQDEIEYEDFMHAGYDSHRDHGYRRRSHRDAFADCFQAGVTVKICTGDIVLTHGVPFVLTFLADFFPPQSKRIFLLPSLQTRISVESFSTGLRNATTVPHRHSATQFTARIQSHTDTQQSGTGPTEDGRSHVPTPNSRKVAPTPIAAHFTLAGTVASKACRRGASAEKFPLLIYVVPHPSKSRRPHVQLLAVINSPAWGLWKAATVLHRPASTPNSQ